MNKRLVWADSLKGVLIVLVVLGHAIQNTIGSQCQTNHLWNIIYSFHMPAFMAISGYLAYRTNSIIGGGQRLYNLVIQESPTTNSSFLFMDLYINHYQRGLFVEFNK